MTVNDIIDKINDIDYLTNKFEELIRDDDTIVQTAEFMRQACDLLEEYRAELGRRKVVC